MAEFAYNNKAHTGTKVSPFEANSGQNLRIGFELRKKGKYERCQKCQLQAGIKPTALYQC